MAVKPIYRIFISSPFVDLRQERQKLFEQVLLEGHIPSGMETFSAGNQDDFSVIKKAIDECDIYVVLVGHRYGSVTPEGKSYTQMEFEYAQRTKKPTLAFLLDEADANARRNKIEEGEQEIKYTKEYWSFREQVVKGSGRMRRLIGFFGKHSGEPDLTTALHELLERGDVKSHGLISADSEARLLGAARNNEFVNEIVEGLAQYDQLYARCETNKELKIGTGQYFWDVCLARIIEQEFFSLFFESGSTIAFLSAEFSRRLELGRQSAQWQIRTNNVLTYFHFMFRRVRPYHQIDVDLVPVLPYPPPEAQELSKDIENAVDEFAKKLGQVASKTLILSATSGLVVSNGKMIGPHVGDFHNMLFKRALLRTPHPMVLFGDESKIRIPFDSSRCYWVCGSGVGETWEDVCREKQIALCIGFKTKKMRDTVSERLFHSGFTNIAPVDGRKSYGKSFPLLAWNARFQNAFPLDLSGSSGQGGRPTDDGQTELEGHRHVFLSYCRENLSNVAELRRDLVAAGERVWWDQDILPGQNWKSEIRKAMKQAFAVVVCLSKDVETRTSSGIYAEIRDAIGAMRNYLPGSIFLIPVRLAECQIPDIQVSDADSLVDFQYVDLFPAERRDEGLVRLLKAINYAPDHP